MNESLFSSLQKHWAEITDRGQALTFRQGQTLFYEGHDPCGVFVVCSGQVKLSSSGAPCRRELWESPSGKVMGLFHLFSGSPFCCTGVAKTDCEVLFISKTQLMPFLSQTEMSATSEVFH